MPRRLSEATSHRRLDDWERADEIAVTKLSDRERDFFNDYFWEHLTNREIKHKHRLTEAGLKRILDVVREKVGIEGPSYDMTEKEIEEALERKREVDEAHAYGLAWRKYCQLKAEGRLPNRAGKDLS